MRTSRVGRGLLWLMIIFAGLSGIYMHSVCPCDGIPGGVEVGDRCLWKSSVEHRNQTEARAYCKSIKPEADLAIIDSDAKDTAISSLALSLSSNRAWLGLYDFDPTVCRDWRWLDGRPLGLKYVHWATSAGQPNGISLDDPDSSHGIQDCIEVKDNNKWHDHGCYETSKVVFCECCYEPFVHKTTEEKVFVREQRRAVPLSSQDDDYEVDCSLKCLAEPSCCAFLYHPDTQQCELHSSESDAFVKKN